MPRSFPLHRCPFVSCAFLALIFAASVALSACTVFSGAQTAVVKDLATPAGQLFCQVNTVTGPVVVGIIDAAAAGLGGVATPAAVIATGATAAAVQADCKLAAASVGGVTGIPVSPPAVEVGNVAIKPVSATLAGVTVTVAPAAATTP